MTDGTSGTVGEGLTGTYGTLTLNADGSYSYAATASAVEALGAGTTANDTFTYTVTDGDQTASAELVITVQGVNDVPVAASDAIAVLENGEVGLASAQNVLTDDTDAEGDTLSINAFRTGGLSVTDGTSGTVGEGLTGTYGTLTLNADGSYSYAATASAVEALGAGTTANDTFTYTVTDGDQTASAELVITVQGVNDVPVAASDAIAVLENGEVGLGIKTFCWMTLILIPGIHSRLALSERADCR